MRKDLHSIAIRIYKLCLDHKIDLDIEWIPRTEIQRADYISRLIDIDDWQITQKCFDLVEEAWGPHTIDCFANYYNTKFPRFFSWHWNPGCTGVDFFVQNVVGENCLVVPPICLIARALHYLQQQEGRATVIVPFWPSSYFWPVVSRHLADFIVEYKVLNGRKALTPIKKYQFFTWFGTVLWQNTGSENEFCSHIRLCYWVILRMALADVITSKGAGSVRKLH